MNKQLVSRYGTLWARNKRNIRQLHATGKLWGVYVLCDGSMPVYIGRGRLDKRIRRHRRSKSRGQFWDHFSWFAISDKRFLADVEALLLRMLPFYLRSLNRQRTRFVDAQQMKQEDPKPDPIRRPSFTANRKRR